MKLSNELKNELQNYTNVLSLSNRAIIKLYSISENMNNDYKSVTDHLFQKFTDYQTKKLKLTNYKIVNKRLSELRNNFKSIMNKLDIKLKPLPASNVQLEYLRFSQWEQMFYKIENECHEIRILRHDLNMLVIALNTLKNRTRNSVFNKTVFDLLDNNPDYFIKGYAHDILAIDANIFNNHNCTVSSWYIKKDYCSSSINVTTDSYLNECDNTYIKVI